MQGLSGIRGGGAPGGAPNVGAAGAGAAGGGGAVGAAGAAGAVKAGRSAGPRDLGATNLQDLQIKWIEKESGSQNKAVSYHIRHDHKAEFISVKIIT